MKNLEEITVNRISFTLYDVYINFCKHYFVSLQALTPEEICTQEISRVYQTLLAPTSDDLQEMFTCDNFGYMLIPNYNKLKDHLKDPTTIFSITHKGKELVKMFACDIQLD